MAITPVYIWERNAYTFKIKRNQKRNGRMDRDDYMPELT